MLDLAAAYWPSQPRLVLGLLGGLMVTLLSGLGLMRLASKHPMVARGLSWGVVLAGFSAYAQLTTAEPPGVRMLLIIGMVLFAMKGVVAVETVAAGGSALSPSRWLAWAGGWPGMDPLVFANRPPAPKRAADVRSARDFLARGLVRLAVGLLLLFGAAQSYRSTGSVLLGTVLALPGLSLVLHFGIFNLLCALWRWVGFPVYTLFPAPLASKTLGEFWGRRWNLPFTEMIQRAVYRPLLPALGRRKAALLGFLCSGLLHECAISVPVGRGYGLPMLYFVIHGGLVTVERATGLDDWLRERPVWSRGWTLSWLALPMGILFHRPFLEGIVWPLAGFAR